ncbi:MAG: GDSL-type esterase/lipase family protein [Planctomycetota bacterium]|nr:GDSL-type esterase/lipase family protein [Planctomycetota bacterium]
MILSSLTICLLGSLQAPAEITPVPREHAWWQQRHELINERAQQSNSDCNLIFIGDSITQAWENAGAPIWEKHFEPHGALNLGISGDRTQHVLWRLQNGNLDSITPSLAVVMIGTNNAANSEAVNTAAGIEAIVDELSARLPDTKVLLLNIFPRGATADDSLRQKNDQVNKLIAKLGQRDQIDVLDISDYFLSDNDLLNTNIMPDLLHLSELGYNLWQSGINSYIRNHFALKFLQRNMSTEDSVALSDEFLIENIELAYSALDEAPWRDQISNDMFLNYILPYAQLNEEREAWRPRLRDICQPMIADCESAADAALALNSKLFNKLNVKYSTKRNRADQAPSETIETGLASCTGLSILLADACRAVGIPARIAGIAEWPDGEGNHSWVEIWDNGWHFLGAAEPDANGLNHAWFKSRVAGAIPGGKNAVWAASFKRTADLFPLPWLPDQNFVFANDVTSNYVGKDGNADPYQAIYDVALKYFSAPAIERDSFTFDMNLDALVKADINRAKNLVWEAYRNRPAASFLKSDFENSVVSAGDYTSPYTVKEVGERPKNGWQLVIAMHGGGGVPKEFNDSQWEHMQIYYKDALDSNGYKYVALRAPNDVWNGFYDSYVWPLVTQLIKQFGQFGDIDLNRVHLIGYSHGGYGAFAIGTRIPHRFASVHASAAAPTPGVSSAENLRNTNFSFMVGELDTSYGRLERCKDFQAELESLRAANPGYYPTEFSLVLNYPHGGLPDRELLSRQLKFSRESNPQHLTWHLTDDATPEFSWLSIRQPRSGQNIDAKIYGQEIAVSSSGVDDLTIWLDDSILDLSQQVVVKHNGVHTIYSPEIQLSNLCQSMLLNGDPNFCYPAKFVQ